MKNLGKLKKKKKLKEKKEKRLRVSFITVILKEWDLIQI
jgi:hypothetical protein